MTEETTLILMDGHNMAYRSFHAIRTLSTQDGHPTNALYGFIRALNQIRDRRSPTHWCVVFDGGLPEERTTALPQYKAQRPPMPESLRPQMDDIAEYLDLADVPRLRIEGQEADDVIASICARSAAPGVRILLVTSDKDFYQLVRPGVSLVPPSDLALTVDAASVQERTGVPPRWIVDWLALTGDTVDNIPGVPGIGPKTAAALLRKHEGMAGLLAALDGLEPPRIRDLLGAHRPTIERNIVLMRLRTDLATGGSWADWRVRAPLPHRLEPFLRRMEFHSLLKDLREPRLF